MNNKLYWLLGIVILVIVIIAGAMLLSNKSGNQPSSTQNSQSQSQNQQGLQKILAETATITLTSTGFEPKTVTIKTGGRVVWNNASGDKGTVNSDPYPTDAQWPFLNLGIFDNGSSVSVTFENAGKYTYHNHLKPEQTGTVMVQ